MALFQRRDLTLNDGTQIWLRKDTGIVESVKDWSETHVHSSGGGGYLSEGTGHISAPTVTSSSVHRQVFFLKREDGTQTEYDTTLIGVAAGHRVTVVSGAKKGKDVGHSLGFFNHTTDKYAFYSLKEYKCGDFGRRKLGWLLFAVYLILCFYLWRVAYGLFVLSVCFAGYGYVRRRHFKAFYKDLTSKALALMREE